MSDITISVTDAPGLCYRIRKQVFIEEQGFPEDLDAFDQTATHLLAVGPDGPVGAARIVYDGEVAKIGRICLLPSVRGKGVGAAVVRYAMEVARAHPGITTAKLSAQVRAMGFYESLGFRAEGPPHDDLGVPHQMMVRPL